MSKNVQGGTTAYNVSHKSGRPDETNSEDTSEVDDSQADETEEELEDSESTESDDNEEEEDSDTEDDSEEEDTEQILDLTKVPPQFKEVAKKMIATQNKWIEKTKKALEEEKIKLNDEYSAQIVKAAGFDKLTKLQGFEQFWDDISNGREYGYSSKFRSNGKNTNEDDDDSSASGDGKLTADSLLNRLTPAIKKMIADEFAPLREKQAEDTWADAEKNLPNFKIYKARVSSILTKYPNMSIQEAYERASEKDRMDAAIKAALEEAQKTGKKIPGKTLRPGASTSGKTGVDRKTIDSIDKALSAAAASFK